MDAGTYIESVVVDKAVFINGSNYDKDPTVTGTRFAEAILLPNHNSPYDDALISIQTSNVSIKGLYIDGDNPLISGGEPVMSADVNMSDGIQNGPTYGTYYQIDHLNIENNIFKNFTYDGVFIWTTFGVDRAFNYIHHNYFDNMWEGIQTYAMQADISDNKFTSVNRGLSMHGIHVATDPLFVPKITNNKITIDWTNPYNEREMGIWVNYRDGSAPPLEVSNNEINCPTAFPTGKTFYGFYALTIGNDRILAFNDNTINGYGNCDRGFYMSSCPSNNITLHGGSGSFNNIKESGVLVVNRDATWGSGNAKLLVDDLNITMSSGGVGVKVYADPAYTTTASATITNNCHITGGSVGVLADGVTASVNVYDNTATITGNTVGVEVANSGSASVNTSTITANGTGIHVLTSGNLTSCANNFITSNTTAGVKIESTAGTIGTITNNDLSGNPLGNAINNAAALISATCNWYGTNTVSGVASAITGLVTYDPWLSNGTDIGDPGFVPGGTCNGATNLYVNDTDPLLTDDIYTTAIGSDANPGTAAAPFLTIGKAVTTAMVGTHIWIDAGSFPEQLSIGKTLDISGVDRTKTIVQAPLTMSAVLTGNGNNVYPIIYAYGEGNTINVEKILIDGDGGRNSNKFEGIHYFAASGTFTNNRITGIRNNPFDGSDDVAFVANHVYDVSVDHTLTVTGNLIDDYGKGGIVINELNTRGIVTGNTITGANVSGKLAQNGIQFGFGAYGTITGNTVTNNIWNAVEHPHTWTAAGILLASVGISPPNVPTGNTTTVSGNILSGNENALSMGAGGYGYTSNAGITIGANTFSNNKVHVWLDDPATIPPAPVSYDKRVDNPLQTNIVFGCIQYAIDEASSGNTLTASAGTFAENVVVHTPVTILGPKAAVSGCDPSRGTGEAIVVPAVSDVYGEIFHVAASNVTIKGFTIDGDNPLLPTNGYGFGGADMHAAEGSHCL